MGVQDSSISDISYALLELDTLPVESSTDIHPHTSFTDGTLELVESLEEAYQNNLYEKGAIEHGNPVDEDIDHLTSFLSPFLSDEKNYTSTAIYTEKFHSLRDIVQDIEGGETVTDADPRKLREDIDTLKRTGSSGQDLLDENLGLNYSLIVPHGVELDYNPAIEMADRYEDPVESFENRIIEFLKEAESLNAGYNYVLLSSHYVNTPFEPRYVKKDELFTEMEHDELGQILETYREKEMLKVESISSKLDDMAVPRVSDELMDQEEMEDLQSFIYSPETFYRDEVEDEVEVSGLPSLDIERPGVLAVGAHPTLIERNEEFMDYFREEQGLKTKEEIREDLDQHLSADIDKSDVDSFLGEESLDQLYPDRELRDFYRPMIETARKEDNFIFEINGKGVERQHESVFWHMLDENLFGSDSHRTGEQPSRTEEFVDERYSNNTVFLTEKWLSQLEGF